VFEDATVVKVTEVAEPDARILSFVYLADVDEPRRAFFESCSSAFWLAYRTILEIEEIPVPTVVVRVVNDVIAASKDAFDDLDAGTEHRTNGERIGGVVVGKAVTAHDASRAVVLFAERAIATVGSEGVSWTMLAMGHELAHVAYACGRTAAGIESQLTGSDNPELGAGLIPVVAAEEFRCDRLALKLMGKLFSANDQDGEPVDLTVPLVGLHLGGLTEALDQVDPALPTAVWRYRTTGDGLGEMWNQVFRVSAEFAVYLAHAEATAEIEGDVLHETVHPARDLLEPFCRPFVDHLWNGPALPKRSEWAADREALMALGREGLFEMWRRLGLHPRQMDDGGLWVDEQSRRGENVMSSAGDDSILDAWQALHEAEVVLTVISNNALENGSLDAAELALVAGFSSLHTSALRLEVGGWWWRSQLDRVRSRLDLVAFALQAL
jgi:hypothetical protein